MALHSVFDEYWVIHGLILLVQVSQEPEDSKFGSCLDVAEEIHARVLSALCRAVACGGGRDRECLVGKVWCLQCSSKKV